MRDGGALNFLDFLRLLRTRWSIVCATIAVGVAGAVAVTLLTTPLYQGSTRLFVSTTAGESGSDIYSGTLSSQQRVLSYTKLVTGETLAQRTIDKLHLNMSAEELRKKVKATSSPNTVLIDLSVLDPSPVRARDIADAMSDEFVFMVAELETPPGGATPNARVVIEQHASLPTKPVIPETTRNVILGLALGVLLGIGLAFLRDLLDNTVKEQRALEEITGAALVGTIPLDKERRKNPTISFAGNHSAMAEAFRELRTNLQFLKVDDPPQVLVVASPMPSEGKSATAINIALALAEADHNVVLVEGDMRRPKIHTYLGLIGSVGFSTVLTGKASLPEVLQKTRFRGLTVLTSGPVPPNPSELLSSMAARKILRELRGAFDYVIIDSSPLLAVTDAAVLAADSDGALLIAKYASTKREQLAHGVASLENVGARILGTIFTMKSGRSKDNYYYGYHGESDGKQSSHRAERRWSILGRRVQTNEPSVG